MNKDQERMIETYIGLSLSAAQTLHKLFKGEMIIGDVKKQTQDFFTRHGLISADLASITQAGKTAAYNYELIVNNRFEHMKPAMSEKAFQVLGDTQKIARLPIVTTLGLRSVHMKALRMIARKPGVAILYMARIFNENSVLDVLVKKDLANYSTSQLDLFLTPAGRNLLRMCAGME